MHRLALLIIALAMPLLAQSSGVTDARYAHLARGVNMETWFLNGSGLKVGASDVSLLKSTGFTCIRLAIYPNTFLPHWVSATYANAYLADVDSVVDLFLNGGMAVMLDFHADSDYLNYYLATPTAPQELISTWQMLAQRYSNRNPELLFFEVLNEPDYRLTEAVWDVEQQKIVAAIHQAAPNHTVIVEPVCCGLDFLLQMTPYLDPNLIYAFHDYNPLTFTHQGATWITNPAAVVKLSGVPYPSYVSGLQTLINQTTDPDALSLLMEYQSEYWDSERINWDIQLAAAWAKKQAVRLVINEFGVYKLFSPPDSRARWLHDMTAAFAKYGLGWAMWDYDGGFDLTVGPPNARAIDPTLLPALGFQPWTAPVPPQASPLPPFTDLRSVQLGGAPIGNGYGEGIVAVDLNADGLPDIVMTTANYPSLPDLPVQVFTNQGGGVMSPAAFTGPIPRQQFVDVIVPGKFDRSGRLGIFLPDQGHGPTGGSGAQSKLVLPAANNTLQDATSNLPQQIVWTIGGAAGDVNGDGADDLAVFYNGSNRLPMQILRNNGTGRFQADAQAFPSWISDLSRRDNSFVCGIFVPRRNTAINDLVAIGWNGTGGRVFRNDGTGRFSDGAILPPPPAGGLSPVTGGCAAVADLNGDGNLDVILGFQHAGANQPDFVQILINNGDGTFHDETDLRIGPLPASQYGLRRIALVPANSGKAHALILSRPGELPLLRIDRGDGVFVPTTAWNPSSSATWDAAGGDFNGDGLLDVVFGLGGDGASIQAQFGRTALTANGGAPTPLQHPVLFSAADAAAFSPSVSPGEWMTIFGLNFLPAGSAAQTWSNFQGNILPTSLGGMSVNVGGKLAAISFLSPTQANVQVPDITTGDYVSISVTTAQGASYGSVFVGPATPSLFEFGKSVQYGLLPAVTAADGTLIGDPATIPGARPAHPGETIVLWGTGFGPTNPANPAGRLITAAPLANAATVVLNGRSITPDYAGLTAVGLNQINFRVPADMVPGSYVVQVIVATASTQAGVSLVVQ